MAALIGLVSQKGGVGKSTLARLIAREYAAAGWQVKIADLDISQGTSTDWKQRRERTGVKPDIAVEPFGTVAQALKVTQLYDLVVFDGPPHSMAGTLRSRTSATPLSCRPASASTISNRRSFSHMNSSRTGSPPIVWSSRSAESATGRTRSQKLALTSRALAIASWTANCQKEQVTDGQVIRAGRLPRPRIRVCGSGRSDSHRA